MISDFYQHKLNWYRQQLQRDENQRFQSNWGYHLYRSEREVSREQTPMAHQKKYSFCVRY